MARRRRQHDINRETPIAPYVMADGVTREVALCFGAKYGTRADANRLGKRAEELYARSESFRKKMKRRDPRPILHAFMLHWHAAELMKRSRKVGDKVAEAAWHGTPLTCPRRRK